MSFLNKAEAIANARIEIVYNHWYVPHYTRSIPQQGILSKQILSKTPTDLGYIEPSVSMKGVKNQNLWNFELGSQGSILVPVWINVSFQQRDRQDSQNLYIDTFSDCQFLVFNALSERKNTLMLA